MGVKAAGELVGVEKRGQIALVTLQRAEKLNAISIELADRVAEAMAEAGRDRDVWVVVLRAQGEKAFCVGADLKEAATMDEDGQVERRKHIRNLFKTIRDVPQPVIASVFGYALGGGCELALSCDLVVASEDAIFGLTEARVGLVPGGGGMLLLPRSIGVAKAKEMIFTGKHVDAKTAERLGFVSRVVPRPQLESATMELAEEITRCSPMAVREAKRTINQSFGKPVDDALAIEDEAAVRILRSRDRAEGFAAFNEKRAPRWENR
jgi:enoyl-CoA hydratase